MKIFESDKALAFLDIGPLARGHSVRPIPQLRSQPLSSNYLGAEQSRAIAGS
jgi:diadenosine tetraphosphate (Ap4A) HIT family hydrolase